MTHLPGYVRPDWATHEFQTLPGLMRRQMRRLRSHPISKEEPHAHNQS